MPSDESLWAMAMKICGRAFVDLGPAERVQIMQLAILADLSTDVQLIGEHVAVLAQHGEALVADSVTVTQSIVGQDGFRGIEDNIAEIANWFEKSRLFDGIPT